MILAAVLMAAAAGCGYRMSDGGYLNKDISRVAVTVFDNNTSEALAGISFSNELIREILERTETKVVSAAGAGRIISGTVKAITFSALSRTSTETVVERQVTAKVDVKITDRDGSILWSVKDFSTVESYKTSSSVVNEEANKQEAVEIIAARMAEKLVRLMKNNF